MIKMADVVLKPEKPLNFAIKQQILQTLRRTDVYVIKKSDEEEGLHSTTKINNFHDETILQYDYDKDQGTHTVAFMGYVVAKMGWHISMKMTQQYKDIWDVCNAIDKKAEDFRSISDAKFSMTSEESLVYQLAIREFQNARYD